MTYPERTTMTKILAPICAIALLSACSGAGLDVRTGPQAAAPSGDTGRFAATTDMTTPTQVIIAAPLTAMRSTSETPADVTGGQIPTATAFN
ncbi:hypothetical protein AN189_05450 [Loktanella sp. 3ANDIMAR09]|nr:hypothetical protein AN189_05450 [Loktanella sp. 3ANDIMAR09]